VNLGVLAARNLTRNKLRVGLTIAAVAFAILAFLLLRTILWAWTMASEVAAKDRIATRHKVSIIMSLPKRYIEEIRQIPGVKQATWASWFGGKVPGKEQEFFASLAVDPPSAIGVFDEMLIPEDQKATWLANPKGALVGDVLAKKMGWTLGSKVTLMSPIYDKEMEFVVDAIYTATRKSIDRSQFMFHWEYLNQDLPERRREQIGWVMARIDDPGRGPDIARQIDQHFDEKDTQTITMSERALNLSFLGMFSAILSALNIVSIVILAIMMLILGNTIAMGVRERTHEYGVLRAIGFRPGHVMFFIVAEALLIGLLGGLLGLLISYPLVQNGLGRWLEENMGGFFPYFRIPASTAVIAVALTTCLGILASLLPAWRAGKLSVTNALRRVD
jgi:putative ABC transport system permease protein